MIKLLNNLKVEESVIIKSSIFLMLYNSVEEIYSLIIFIFLEYIKNSNYDIVKMHDKVQNLYFDFHLKRINGK